MIFVIQFIISYLACHVVASELSIGSKVDRHELENIRYHIDIDQNLHASTSIKSQAETILIRSINGQLFTCSFELSQDFDQEIELDIEENSLLSLFTKSAVHDQYSTKSPLKQQFNFSQIDSKVQQQMSKLNESNICLFKNTGWWTYELCFGKYVKQYHLLSNGSIEGEKISLGNFSHNFDWLSADEAKKYPIRYDILYHEQYFEDGSLCELINKPRKATAKIFCDERGQDRIEMVNEIETCVYEIFVQSQSLCSVPNFSKKQISHELKCSPVVSDQVFETYVANKEKESSESSEVESETLSDIDQLTTINQELALELENSEKKLQNLMTKTQEIKSDKNMDKLNNLIEETDSEMSKNDLLFDKLSKKMDNILENIESGTAQGQVISEPTDMFKDADEINVEELEAKLKEKLSKSEKYAKDKIKIKIIKLDTNSLFGTNNFNSLISNLFESGEDRQKFTRMNANYNQIYGKDSIGQAKNIDKNYDTDTANLIVY